MLRYRHTSTASLASQGSWQSSYWQSVPQPRARHRYCGKEKDAESGLYYYGARYYESWTCRFVSVDPASEKYADLSPYNYCFNSPVNITDPDGRDPNADGYIDSETNKVVGYDAKGDNGIYHLVHKINGSYSNIFNGDGMVSPYRAKSYYSGTSLFDDHAKGMFQNLKLESESDENPSHAFVGAPILIKQVAPETLVETTKQVPRILNTMGGVALLAVSLILMPANSSADDTAEAAGFPQPNDSRTKTYVTYTKTAPTSPQFGTYSGRTSGFGDPDALVRMRDAAHMELRSIGYDDAIRDVYGSGLDYMLAIRGREQQLIDFHGGAQSDGGTSGNKIRGVSKSNLLGRTYHDASNRKFQEKYPFTGFNYPSVGRIR